MSKKIKIFLVLIALISTGNALSCDMPLKPAWFNVKVIFIGICTTEDCNNYGNNDPHNVRVGRKVCLANVIIDGKEDTAAVFGVSCNEVPINFSAKTPAKRCYREYPVILEGINS